MTTPPPSPTPFAELLKRATPGPYTVRELTDEFFLRTNHKWAVNAGYQTMLKVEGMGDCYQANAELICRLLSWAHAGGVEELREAGKTVDAVVDEGYSAYLPLAKRLRASLALLDGKK